MRIEMEVPDEIAAALQSGDLSRAALEALALEGYRSGRLGGGQVQRLLEFRTPMQVHAFLREHGVYLNYSVDDAAEDAAVADRLRGRLGRKRTA